MFIGPDESSTTVYCIDQKTKSGGFDEHKFAMGCCSADEARELYLSCYTDGWKCGTVTPLSVKDVKTWLQDREDVRAMASVQFSSADVLPMFQVS